MACKIDEIEGIRPVYATKLNEAGVKTTEDLQGKCATPAGRATLAGTTGVAEANSLKWANRADKRAAKLAEVNEVKKLARSTPPEATVIKWIEAAKTMEPKISY